MCSTIRKRDEKCSTERKRDEKGSTERRVSEVPVETEFAGLKEKSLERLLLDLLLGPMLS